MKAEPWKRKQLLEYKKHFLLFWWSKMLPILNLVHFSTVVNIRHLCLLKIPSAMYRCLILPAPVKWCYAGEKTVNTCLCHWQWQFKIIENFLLKLHCSAKLPDQHRVCNVYMSLLVEPTSVYEISYRTEDYYSEHSAHDVYQMKHRNSGILSTTEASPALRRRTLYVPFALKNDTG